MQPTISDTEVAVIRLLLMDPQRKQVLLCKQPTAPYSLLPCGMLPDDQTPLAYLTRLAEDYLPEAAQAALLTQLKEPEPVAWIYPPASMLPDATDVIQIIYLLTLSPDTLQGKSKRYRLHGEICRFWPTDQLPDTLSPLDEMLLTVIRFAEARDALPIDMRGHSQQTPTMQELPDRKDTTNAL